MYVCHDVYVCHGVYVMVCMYVCHGVYVMVCMYVSQGVYVSGKVIFAQFCSFEMWQMGFWDFASAYTHVIIDAEDFSTVTTADVWPSKVIVRPWRFSSDTLQR